MKTTNVRFANRTDIKDLCFVEEKAWSLQGEIIQAEPKKIAARVKTQQVVTIAMVDGNPAGSQFAFQFDWNGQLESLTTWDQLTSYGWTDKIHDCNGKTGFLVGVGVVPMFRKKFFENNLIQSPQRISQLLLINTFKGLYNKGVREVIACARIPLYHKKNNLSVDDYCSLRRHDGQLFDSVLRFHERLGAQVIKPVAYAMDDSESLDGGCWVKYNLNIVFSTPPWNQIKF